MRKFNFLLLFIIVFAIVFSISCTKDSSPPKSKDALELPSITTGVISNITSSSATAGGHIAYDGRSPVIARGVCYSTDTIPTIDNSFVTKDGIGTGDFTSVLSGLTKNTRYYIRAYATNSKGTAYGYLGEFKTKNAIPDSIKYFLNPSLIYGSLIDIDGNKYPTVQIGAQTWMAENLKTTRYNDGALISMAEDKVDWKNNTTGAWVYFRNDSSYNRLFGKLYNWYAVNTDKLCPLGWHIPSNTEWEALFAYLVPRAGSKLKSRGVLSLYTGYWTSFSPNTESDATNESGFTGMPGGYRIYDASSYTNFNSDAYFWSATDRENTKVAWYMHLGHNSIDAGLSNDNKGNGYSCRCLKD
ncbi:MAG: fibrobacter succinogenes major paralogous domain-containing protein [Chitinophagales bacterium]|nr:fibrobacter succinogenes major paralogous domain-containing protein [Chitinophagales bacterium]MCZ2394677.1 fibrobacter succinogenes major paralogous domain-containing protein [Chitinophagales bacterium]